MKTHNGGGMTFVDTNELNKALLEAIWAKGVSPVASISERFGISRQATHRHLKDLIEKQWVRAAGTKRQPIYTLRPITTSEKVFPINKKLEEHIVWRDFAKPLLTDVDENSLDICNFGFTEMVNNAIDHSEGNWLTVKAELNAVSIVFYVEDDGIGIFQKLAKQFELTPQDAILELSKGKMTTDPARHSGEGIFFTSRAFDRFHIVSDNLTFFHDRKSQDWLIEYSTTWRGTRVRMELMVPSEYTLEKIFDTYSSGSADHRFSRTHIPLQLAQFGNDNLISRSQAKRVLKHVDRFDEVFLDFGGVRSIGQAFADEIFRVFKSERPNTNINPINVNAQVMKMIRRAQFDEKTDE